LSIRSICNVIFFGDVSLNIRNNQETEPGTRHVMTLRTVVVINEKMKQIVRGSNRLYVISLNAMFASRVTAKGVGGFVEVTALLRDFSQRLEKLVVIITQKIDSLITQSALMVKKQKHNKLLFEAVSLSSGVSVPNHVVLSNHKIYDEVDMLSIDFSRQLVLCEKLMQIGDSLAVLAKVEAVSSADDGSLAPITTDMTETINHISENLLASQAIVAN